ncbi:hypothetical protein OXX69_013835, partial [Metschnikowia pulcherrima]
RGRALRRAGPVRHPDELQRHQLRALPVRRRARRPGEQARGDPRRVHHRVPAELLPRPHGAVRHPDQRQRDRELPVPVLRDRAGRAHDLPSARAPSRPAEAP